MGTVLKADISLLKAGKRENPEMETPASSLAADFDDDGICNTVNSTYLSII